MKGSGLHGSGSLSFKNCGTGRERVGGKDRGV